MDLVKLEQGKVRPITIAILILGVWLALGWAYSSTVADKDARIELQDRQLADYREKLDGATPDQAKEKTQTLEAKIALDRSAIGDKDARIELQDRQLADYREKLGGATPDQAKEKIDALEAKIALDRSAIGGEWEVLTSEEASKLSELVAPLPKRRLHVLYQNHLGKDLARSFAETFMKAGWSDVLLSQDSGIGTGISTGHGAGMPETLKDAIEASTKFKVTWLNRSAPEDPDVVYLAVGINSP